MFKNKKYYMHITNTNDDIEMFIIFKSKLSYNKLHNRLCNMFNCYVYLCEYTKHVQLFVQKIISIFDLKNISKSKNFEMYNMNCIK